MPELPDLSSPEMRASASLLLGEFLKGRSREDAQAKHGRPEIFNTGLAVHLGRLHRRADGGWDQDLHVGRGRWMDNVFIERLWRSLKHEDVYLKGYADGLEAKIGIASWMEFYNRRSLHQALGYRTPMEVWCGAMADATAVGMWTTLPR